MTFWLLHSEKKHIVYRYIKYIKSMPLKLSSKIAEQKELNEKVSSKSSVAYAYHTQDYLHFSIDKCTI